MGDTIKPGDRVHNRVTGRLGTVQVVGGAKEVAWDDGTHDGWETVVDDLELAY